ncbi:MULTISPECIES: Lrp/AsnC family transcriptional regulator [Listeria]|uniref:Lrp/AsnC family transcriptional regulator n=1 Tax=Listeria TaxID=1637 RepID=UPI000B597ACA|nr:MULTISPECIES: AsnC family transcriptional regulator [Listeria]
MDELDQEIIKLLKKDAQLTNKEIGNEVHLTGQAVGKRILNLKDAGIIGSYTIKVYYSNKQFIRVFMEDNRFKEVEQKIMEYEEIEEFYKVSGHACFMVVAHFEPEKLKVFIESLSKWARCSVDSVVGDRLENK